MVSRISRMLSSDLNSFSMFAVHQQPDSRDRSRSINQVEQMVAEARNELTNNYIKYRENAILFCIFQLRWAVVIYSLGVASYEWFAEVNGA